MLLGVTRSKPISVLSLIPFKSQVLEQGALLFRWWRQWVEEVSAYGGAKMTTASIGKYQRTCSALCAAFALGGR